MSSSAPTILTPADLQIRLDGLGLDVHAGPCVAVGVSGGPDSMALAWLLARLPNGPAVAAVTVDHGLRQEAANEARMVGTWLNDGSHLTHSILTRVPEKGDTRIMEAARIDRYRMLDDFCRARGIRHLFIAHHRDDQAETVLFRIAKGSGLDGLAGMRPVTSLSPDVALCRPLLDVPRDVLRATCLAHEIPFIDDPSNLDPRYARPRLRAARDILAAEGLTGERLFKLALRMNRASETLDFFCTKAEDETRTIMQTDRIVFSYARLCTWPSEIRLRLLQRAVVALNAQKPYGARLSPLETLETTLFSDGMPRASTLAGCLFTVREKADTLEVKREDKG